MFLASSQQEKPLKVGIAGVGAIGGAVAKALIQGIDGFTLHAYSDPSPSMELTQPNMELEALVQNVDLIIEALPPQYAPILAQLCIKHETNAILISASALLTKPELQEQIKQGKSRFIIPSGALSGIDGISALKQMEIKSAKIASTKKPLAYDGAPYIVQNDIHLSAITEKTLLFKGNALEAAQGFPANLNVAATLSLAGIGAQDTQVEIWADPEITGNQHEVEVQSQFSTIRTCITNMPDPANPKSSMLAAQSIISTLKNMSSPLAVL